MTSAIWSKTATALLVGIAASVITALAGAWISSGLTTSVVTASWTAGVAVMAATFLLMPADPERMSITPLDVLLLVLYGVASLRAFLWLVYADGNVWKVLSPNNLGDLSLHWSFIRYLASTHHWWPASPILEGDPLRYPFGSDLFNALLLRSGVPLPQGLIACALGSAILTGYALWRWGSAMAVAALIFNGGVAGLAVLAGNDPDSHCEWKNLFLTLFVTQRGFLFALPAGLLLLCDWRRWIRQPEAPGLIPVPVAVLFLCAIPLFSVHTALFLWEMMAGILLLNFPVRPRMLRLILIAWPLMAVTGWLVTSGAGGHSAVGSIGWAPGWMSDGKIGFWFWNFGILPLLAPLLLVFALMGRGEPEDLPFVLVSLIVFAACLLIRFAPWPWDNTKLMLWCWLALIPSLWKLVVRPCPVPLRILLLMLLFGSGAVSLALGLDGRHGYEIADRAAMEDAERLLRDEPADAVIACSPEYNHPVLLSGHRAVCGYEGHLWSHGLDYRGRWDLLDSVMKGEPGWREKARLLGVSKIYWSEIEAKRWPGSRLPWAGETKATVLHGLE
jgi:hypothetical protein